MYDLPDVTLPVLSFSKLISFSCFSFLTFVCSRSFSSLLSSLSLPSHPALYSFFLLSLFPTSYHFLNSLFPFLSISHSLAAVCLFALSVKTPLCLSLSLFHYSFSVDLPNFTSVFPSHFSFPSLSLSLPHPLSPFSLSLLPFLPYSSALVRVRPGVNMPRS